MYTLPLNSQAGLSVLYSQSHRYYHNIEHINECLGAFEMVNKEYTFNYLQQKTGVLAIWWHDAIYNPYSTENEEASAKLLESEIDRENDNYIVILTVAEIIRKTAKHISTQIIDNDDIITSVILDIDLHSMGKSWEWYKHNGENIRKEFIHIDGYTFLANRLAFLKKLNERKTFFYTDYFKEKYGSIAKNNVEKDIYVIEKSNCNYKKYMRLLAKD